MTGSTAAPDPAPTEAPEPPAGPPAAPGRATGIPPEALTERSEHARARGLPGLSIAGGEDPDLNETVARERPYLQALIAMVVVIIAGGFLLGLIGMVVGGATPP